MAGQYIGVSGICKKGKGWKIGASGTCRNVKGGKIGVSGICRKFFPSEVYYYKNGDVCQALTGGYSFASANAGMGPTVTGWSGVPDSALTSTCISISIPDQARGYYSNSVGNMSGIWRTNNKINISSYSTLYFRFDVTFGHKTQISDSDFYFVSMGLAADTYFNSAVTAYYFRNHQGDKTQFVYALDVSGISGWYYIYMFAARVQKAITNGDDSLNFKVYEIWAA